MGALFGALWASIIAPLTDGPPSILTSYAIYIGSFAFAGLTVGFVQWYPEIIAIAAAEFMLTVTTFAGGPNDGWIVLWLCAFDGSGLLWAPIIGLIFRHYRDGFLESDPPGRDP
jgi:hypothetical protein